MKLFLLVIFLFAQSSLLAQYLELNLNVLNLKEKEHASVVLINNTTGTKETIKYRYKKFPIILQMENQYKILIQSEGYATKSMDVDLICGNNKKAVFEMNLPMTLPKPKEKESKAGYIKYQEKEKALIYKITDKNKAGTISLL